MGPEAEVKLLNRANFSNQDRSVFNCTRGRTRNADLISTRTKDAREIQLALKLTF